MGDFLVTIITQFVMSRFIRHAKSCLTVLHFDFEWCRIRFSGGRTQCHFFDPASRRNTPGTRLAGLVASLDDLLLPELTPESSGALNAVRTCCCSEAQAESASAMAMATPRFMICAEPSLIPGP
jgi:hypothetical protein